MSCLRLCDADDCYQSENDTEIWHIDYETGEFLKEHCSSWFKYSYSDICKDCIDMTNEDFEGFFTLKDDDLAIGQKYLDNPNLIK